MVNRYNCCMMMTEQKAKRILDILAKRVGYVCCEIGEPQLNSLDQVMMQGEADMMSFPLALRGSEPNGYREYLSSKTNGYVKAVFPTSNPEEFRKIQWSTLLAKVLEASVANNEDIYVGTAGIHLRYPKILFPPKPTQKIFLKTGTTLEQLEILADVFTSAKEIT